MPFIKPNKVDEYYRRGEKPLSIGEVENVLAMHPFMRAPQNIIILDGDVKVPYKLGRSRLLSTAVGLTPTWEDTIILTPLSDRETVTHELVHEAVGLREIPTRLVTPFVRLRENFPALRTRTVKYAECYECEDHPDLFTRYGLKPTDDYPPNIRHYILLRRPHDIRPTGTEGET